MFAESYLLFKITQRQRCSGSSLRMLVFFYQTAGCHIADGINLYIP